MSVSVKNGGGWREKNIIIKAITIPTTGWVVDADNGMFVLSISDDDIDATSVADINLALASLSAAEDCGLKPVTESYDGGMNIYSDSEPTAEITGTLIIQKGVS